MVDHTPLKITEKHRKIMDSIGVPENMRLTVEVLAGTLRTRHPATEYMFVLNFVQAFLAAGGFGAEPEETGPKN